MVEEIKNPNSEEVEDAIIGETFIKPKTTNRYYFNGSLLSDWRVEGKNLPLKINKVDDYTLDIMWDSTYSGQFVLSYGDYDKTIVVESLFWEKGVFLNKWKYRHTHIQNLVFYH